LPVNIYVEFVCELFELNLEGGLWNFTF